jgi:Ca2+-binding EF-hand superfamily protein
VLKLMLLIGFVTGGKRQAAIPPTPQPPAASVVAESPDAEPTQPASPEIVVAAETNDNAPPPADDSPNEDLADAVDPSAADTTVDEPSATSTDDPDVEIVEAEKPPQERFLLLTRDGPLVIDVVLRIDDEPYTNALEHLVDRVMQDLEGDEATQPTWAEMIDNPKFAYGQFGNLAPEDADQKTRLVEMYDTNRNSLVDRDELPRFLTRNVGGSRPFSLRSSNEYRGDNRTRSPTRLLLDVDHDGAITADEMQSAPSRLFERDADDDEILVLADFKDSVEQMQPQMSNQRRVNAPDTAILIGDRTRWGYVSYALQETYAYGERIGVDDIPLTPELVELLDENNNTRIDKNEVQKLADVPAHLVLEVSFFDATKPEQTATPGIRILSVCDSLSSALDAARQHPTRMSFDLPGANVEFFVNEDPALANTSQTVDAQFSMLDADNNSYLDTDEYSGQVLGFSIPFEALDADGDAMVQKQEVHTLLEQRQAVIRAQIRARAADQEDALFSALDINADGRLTAREIYGVPHHLKNLDRNQDGQVQSHEIPGTMAVGFIRGNAQQDTALFIMPSLSPPSDGKDLPAWFVGMDSNGDGDISPREFLGSSDKFRQLDADSDGFVSGDEARQLGV